ncbi:hypothetical protein SAMN04488024_102275 [Pedobacter soli]|uniref:Uncharacterized protein n=2 Tax=Sphingobacteriaceae TaxID=84566 RepID=A0A1G6MAB0_9SPHI|nr:hypothetical protein SAMN04488024_102275 [Pedobacter soli]
MFSAASLQKINHNDKYKIKIYNIMKAQHTNTSAKLAKKTVFVYKNIKAKNSLFETTPTGDQSHTVVMTSWIDVI